MRIIEGLSVFITFPEITCPDGLVCMLLRVFSCSSFLVVILFVLICYHPRCSAKIQQKYKISRPPSGSTRFYLS